MELTVHIPDDLAARMTTGREDLSRKALEALALQEYACGHLTRAELRRLLGFDTGDQLDGFLKLHGVEEDYTLDDLQRELEGLQRLGI